MSITSWSLQNMCEPEYKAKQKSKIDKLIDAIEALNFAIRYKLPDRVDAAASSFQDPRQETRIEELNRRLANVEALLK